MYQPLTLSRKALENLAPDHWLDSIIQSVGTSSLEVILHHFVGAILERRFKEITIHDSASQATNLRAQRGGDFVLGRLIYHVAISPSRAILQQCCDDIRAGLLTILVVPSEQETRAKFLAEEAGIDKALTILTIESYAAFGIMQFAIAEHKDPFSVLQEIVHLYNQRLAAVETDLSLQIQVQ